MGRLQRNMPSLCARTRKTLRKRGREACARRGRSAQASRSTARRMASWRCRRAHRAQPSSIAARRCASVSLPCAHAHKVLSSVEPADASSNSRASARTPAPRLDIRAGGCRYARAGAQTHPDGRGCTIYLRLDRRRRRARRAQSRNTHRAWLESSAKAVHKRKVCPSSPHHAIITGSSKPRRAIHLPPQGAFPGRA